MFIKILKSFSEKLVVRNILTIFRYISNKYTNIMKNLTDYIHNLQKLPSYKDVIDEVVGRGLSNKEIATVFKEISSNETWRVGSQLSLRETKTSGGGNLKYIDSTDALSDQMNKERANCVPRAIAMATGSTYKEAYDFCAKRLGRKHGRGTNVTELYNGKIKTVLKKKVNKITSPNEEEVVIQNKCQPRSVYTEYGETVVRNMTTKTFIKHYPKGTFLVSVDKHTFCFTNGLIKGNPKDAEQMRRIVLRVIELV